MCQDEGRLMAFLDGELPAEERAEVETHLRECAECANALEGLRADRAVTSEAFAKLEPAAAPVVPLPAQAPERSSQPAAAIAFQPARARVRNRYDWRAVAALAAVLLLASFAFGPVRNAAASLLQVFRVQQVQTVTLTQADLESLQATLESGSGHVDLESFGEAWVEGVGKEPKQVTLEQAQAAVDFPVLLPANQPAKPDLTLMQAQTIRFKLNVDAVNEALTYYGSDRTLPKSLDDKTFTVKIPAIVLATYGDGVSQTAPTGPVDPDDPSAGAASGPFGGAGAIYVGQARSPELIVPDGVDVAELRDLLINLPFLPENLRTQLAAINDWQSTLIIPNVDGTAHNLTIDGTPVVVYSPNSAARDARAQVEPLPDSTTVIWNDNGVVRAVGGSIDQAAAIALAKSTMK